MEIKFLPIKLSPKEQEVFDLMADAYRTYPPDIKHEAIREYFATPARMILERRVAPSMCIKFDSKVEAEEFLCQFRACSRA
jgi:hypothetical protein